MAASVLEVANDYNNVFAENYWALGNAYYQQKNYELAVNNWKKSVEINPSFAESLSSHIRNAEELLRSEDRK